MSIFTAETLSTLRNCFIFCFPLSPAKDQRDVNKRGKQKSATLRSDNLLLRTKYPHKCFECPAKLKV